MNKPHTLILLFLGLASPLSHANCVVLDYQEMKDMPTAELTMEYCSAKKKSISYRNDSWAESKFASEMGAWATSSADANEVDAARSKADRLQQSANQCKDQMKRMVRVLEASGTSLQAVDAACSVKT